MDQGKESFKRGETRHISKHAIRLLRWLENRGIGEQEENSAAVKEQEDVFFPSDSITVPMSMVGGFMVTPLLFGIAG